MTTAALPRYLDERELADMLGVSPRTLRRWREGGSGPPFVAAGGRVRYRLASVERWAQQREQTRTVPRRAR